MIKKIVIALWALILLGFIAGAIFFVSIAKGWIGYMPPIEKLENPDYKFATQVFSEDGKVLGTYSLSKENRVSVGYNDLPASLINALIATEDVRYTSHSGIDGIALARAIIKRGILMQTHAGGGSTITQQLSKQLYSPGAGSILERLTQKPIEWVIAVKLERYYTKEEIITMYLNKFDFLNNAVGIKTASYTYFGCLPKDLKIEQSATLVGMCKNPSLYNPVRHNKRSRGRRNVVLNQMRKAGYISQAECDSLKNLPLTLSFHRVDHKEGLATYFREYLRGVLTAKEPVKSKYRGWQKQKFYDDSVAWKTNPLYGWCNKNKKKDGKKYNLYTDGLRIYTTINSKMQTYAEEAVNEHIGGFLQKRFFEHMKHKRNAPFTKDLEPEDVKRILNRSIHQSDRYRIMKKAGYSLKEIMKAFNKKEKMTVYTWDGLRDTVLTPLDSIRYYKHFLRTGFMSMDPRNGHVKAYVGGINYTYFQYDMAMMGRRQVGSTIKPYLYSLAMQDGFTPCDQVRNVEQTIITEAGQVWRPRNSSRKRYGEMVPLKWGLAHSNNWISAYLIKKVNPYALVRLLHNYGINSQQIQPTPSLALGPCEISVGEMVGAYSAFSNNGIRTEPLFVTRIEDNEGNVITNFTPRMVEVISANSAAKMITMLRAVIDEGTGNRIRRIYKIKADMGGKTGTTNDNSDGWFMGFTPSLVSGCWVGGEEPDIHFDSMRYGQGASMALPVWGLYMQKVYADMSLGYSEDETFTMPENFVACDSIPTDTTIVQPKSVIIDDSDNGLDDFFN